MTDIPQLLELPFCNSTNDELRQRPELLRAHGAALFTLDQRAGRGRLGRRWLSPAGNLALSVVLHAPTLQSAQLIPVLSGLLTFQVLCHYAASLSLKWPNDILLNGRKLCGILCESVEDFLQPPALAVIIGIGVNLTERFTTEIPLASLSQVTGWISGQELAKQLVMKLRGQNLPISLSPDFIAAWNKAAQLPATFYYGGHQKVYTAQTLMPDGRLQAEHQGEQVFLDSGEILLCLPPI